MKYKKYIKKINDNLPEIDDLLYLLGAIVTLGILFWL
jgi:hypothetical protein